MTLPTSPQIPKLFAIGLQALPRQFHDRALIAALNGVFRTARLDGEFDFLNNKALFIKVRDAGITYHIGLKNGDFVPAQKRSCDLLIEGAAYDFMLLATRREDHDTLFFNRQLRLNGDTELGLYVKNFLDAFEFEHHWQPLVKILEQITLVLERFFRPVPPPLTRQ